MMEAYKSGGFGKNEYRMVYTQPGEVLKFGTQFEENPYLRTGVPQRMGSVERLDYTTSVYENGIEYKKTAYVYLPYCYDKNDSSRKYNVLYFQHGNTCEPAMFAVGGNKYMFDMLFDSGELDPCIIVFVSYYMDPMRDAAIRTQTGGAEAGDGWTPGIPGNFHREIVQNIIPIIEDKYNTYYKDALQDEYDKYEKNGMTVPLFESMDNAIIATRDHRAFAGYSRGGAWTWRMLHHAFPYFRWYCPTSGAVCCDKPLPMPPGSAPFPTFTDEEILDYVTAPIKANPDLPFYIYAASGGPMDGASMRHQMKLLSESEGFSFGPDPAVNNIYYSLSDYYHTDYLVPYYFWNYLKILFKI